MYCTNCGKEIESGTQYCMNCGKKQEILSKEQVNEEQSIETFSNENQVNEPDMEEQQEDTQEKKFNFSKKTKLGVFLYKHIQTNIEVRNQTLNIDQNIMKFPAGSGKNSYSIKISDISNISIGTRMDIWNTVIAILCIFEGFSEPWLFIIAVILLGMSYGKILKIVTNNGNKCLIPYKGDSEQAEKLINVVKNRN